MEPIKKSDLIAYRSSKPEDINFILATWLRGLRYGNELFEQIDKDIYFAEYHKVIEALLRVSQVRVACLKDDPDTILGYAVLQGDKVHWIHIKSAWRRIGIAKSLLYTKFGVVTHLTTLGAKLLKEKCTGVKFNPFL